MPFDNDETQRYSRHFVLPSIGPFGQDRLKKAKTLVIGAGGLGSAAIMYLAAAGVGTIGIADPDRVEPSNLNRQVIHCSLGRNKAESAAAFVERLNYHVKAIAIPEKMTADNLAKISACYDFVLDCTDGFDVKFMINDVCVATEKPYCHGGATGVEGQIMTYVPGSPCLRCIMGDVPQDAPTCAEVGVLGAAVGVIGCMQAVETVKYIVGSGELLLGRLIKYDGLRARFQTLKFGTDARCPVCGVRKADEDITDNRL